MYRAVNHGQAKNACANNKMMKKFPKEIEDFGNEFVKAQIKRHAADYNPTASFVRSEVVTDIESAEDVIKRFRAASVKDRRAFAAWLTLNARK